MNTSFKSLLIIIILGLSLNSYSQVSTKINPKPFNDFLPFTSVNINDSTPDWAILMYSENPNMEEVERKYAQWRINNPTLKNGHTRNFKHYYNYLTSNDGVGKDGYVLDDLEEKINDKKIKWEKERKSILENKKRKSSTRSSNNNTDWESLGPFRMERSSDTVDVQVNIYSMTQGTSDPNILYATSEAGGTVFKSIDKGENWSSPNDNISFNGYREIEVDPSDEDIVYLGSQNDIYKSIDGGLTWNSMFYNYNNKATTIIIDPIHPDTILVAGFERILRTTDGGNNWSEVFSGKVFDVRFMPGNTSIVYALVDNATTFHTDFYKSTNNGVTWTKITNGWPNEASTSNSGGRMTTSDGTPGLIYAFIGATYSALPADDSKKGVKVLKSTDSGTSWTTVLNYDDDSGVNRGQGFYDWDIEVSDTDPNIVLLGTQGKWLTTNGFADFNWAHTGLGHADLQEALFNGTDLWVATDGGIIKFTDETFDHYDTKSNGINATSFWSFDQGWNRDAQVGSHYHNGTSARTDSYIDGTFLNYGGAEPQFSAIKHPTPDKAWSKGYGAVNGKSLPDDITTPITSFSYNITPNAEYGSSTWKESEIEVLPYAYNTHFTGSGNVLWRSDNFGASWDTVAVVGNGDSKVTKIEISRANPQVIYFAEYNPSQYQLYKSDDLGETITSISGPNVWDSGVLIEVDQMDENILYFSTTNGGDSNDKVYKSINGGTTWTNLSTDMLDGHAPRAMLNVAGTDGGLYIVSSTAVFYRNNTMSDWDILITNLPSSPALRDIKPYYKEGKVRVAGDGRGVWGAELYDTPTNVIVQPSVNIGEGMCARDTFYFDDFSVVNHDGINWEWEISPSPSYIESTTKRNPKVVFGNEGSYDVSMTITDQNNVQHNMTIPNMVNITEKCIPDTLAGKSFKTFNNGDNMVIQDIDLTNVTHFSVTGWMKPDSTLQAYAALFSDGQWCAHCTDTKGLLVNYHASRLWYKWPGEGNPWGSNSGGLDIPMNEWSYVALTIEPTKATLYLNEEKYEHIRALDPTDISSLYIAKGHYSKSFRGEIDEVTFWNRTLTYDEIKKLRHITKEDQIEIDTDLIAYYQFNEDLPGGQIMDKAGINHGVISSGTELVNSSAPLGGGTSEIINITSGGTINSVETGVNIVFPSSGTFPNGDIVISRINNPPNENPSNSPTSGSYWVINNYGSNQSFSQLNSIRFTEVGNVTPNSIAANYSVTSRTDNEHENNWVYVDRGDVLNISNSELTFDQDMVNTSFGQYAISNNASKGWIGVVSTEWDNPLNWGAGILPTNTSDVIIPANVPYFPIVNINDTIRSLTIMKNARLGVVIGRELNIIE